MPDIPDGHVTCVFCCFSVYRNSFLNCAKAVAWMEMSGGMESRWWWMKSTTMGLRILSWSLIWTAINKMHAVIMAHPVHNTDISKQTLTHNNTTCHLICTVYKVQSARSLVKTQASLGHFLTVCAEIFWICKPVVASTDPMAGLRWSFRWRSLGFRDYIRLQIWGSWMYCLILRNNL